MDEGAENVDMLPTKQFIHRFDHALKCQINGGVPIIRGVGKLPKFNKRGVKINGGSEF